MNAYYRRAIEIEVYVEEGDQAVRDTADLELQEMRAPQCSRPMRRWWPRCNPVPEDPVEFA